MVDPTRVKNFNPDPSLSATNLNPRAVQTFEAVIGSDWDWGLWVQIWATLPDKTKVKKWESRK